MKKSAFTNVERALYREFCEKYGEIITLDDVRSFLNRLDDLREVNENYVGYLFDYVTDFNLWA